MNPSNKYPKGTGRRSKKLACKKCKARKGKFCDKLRKFVARNFSCKDLDRKETPSESSKKEQEGSKKGDHKAPQGNAAPRDREGKPRPAASAS